MYSLKRMLGALALALLALPLLNLTAQAQDKPLKIGYTDPETIIAAMPEYGQIQQQLQQEYQTAQQQLQTLSADFQDKLEKYQKQQPLLSAESRAKREQELQQLQQQLQQSAAQKDQEMAQREQELMKPLLDKVQAAINEVAGAEGLALVLRAPALIYVDDSQVINITESVARKLGIPVDDTSADTSNTSNAN
ncbi:OmpH family outer membrane protein [Rhodocaloribacter sp.]